MTSHDLPCFSRAETFGFGLALAQSLPGPLFNFSAFLGSVMAGVPGGFLGFLGLFGPGALRHPPSPPLLFAYPFPLLPTSP